VKIYLSGKVIIEELPVGGTNNYFGQG